ncbi:MAG: hypothetical protein ACQEST_01600 [Bacteroidota bacterium]
MLFQQKNTLNSSETKLVQNTLEKLIGQPKSFCRNLAENRGFTFLDQWGNKMGFIKEKDEQLEVLCIYFDDQKCVHYQVIIKKTNQTWMDSKTFDYNSVREMGIINS